MAKKKFYIYSQTRIEKVLKRLEVPENLRKAIKSCAEECENMQLHPSDLILTKHFYRVAEDTYGIPDWKSEDDLREFLSDLTKTQLNDIKLIFAYKDKPTPKKFIQLILTEALV